jgi:hypothetical protein
MGPYFGATNDNPQLFCQQPKLNTWQTPKLLRKPYVLDKGHERIMVHKREEGDGDLSDN